MTEGKEERGGKAGKEGKGGREETEGKGGKVLLWIPSIEGRGGKEEEDELRLGSPGKLDREESRLGRRDCSRGFNSIRLTLRKSFFGSCAGLLRKLGKIIAKSRP